MTGLAVTGIGIVSAAGTGARMLAGVAARAAGGLADEPLPPAQVRAYADFDVREHLGRKGTAFFDRVTGLALVACGRALEDSGLTVDDDNRAGFGVVLGTTVGSLKSTCDYSRETLVQDRPYLVNPVLFPNTVMNCASGQAAIWYGLKGVNATIAGGQLAFLSALRYAANACRAGLADVVLVGAVEEYTTHSAWLSHLTGAGAGVGAGEGAAVFVVEDAASARAAGRAVRADVLSVAVGYAPGGVAGGSVPGALADCVRRALGSAGVTAGDVALVATSAGGQDERDRAEREGVGLVVAGGERLDAKAVFGDCQSATAALTLAAVLARHDEDPSRAGEVSVLTSCTPDGGVGAAVVRGWGGGNADSR
jgi:3-oxoacyl-[acyl-carrier-protein] synthase II